MKKVTYMDHDGYIVATDHAILVFDYTHDPSHALHRALENNPSLPVVFFETHHRREPHDIRSLYEIAQNHRRTYVLSNDIYPQNIPSDLDVAGMSAGDIIDNIPGIKSVHAYGSNNGGVTFAVVMPDDSVIYHAGSMRHNHSQINNAENRDHGKINSVINHVADDFNAVDIAMLPTPAPDVEFADSVIDAFTQRIKVTDLFPMEILGHKKDSCPYTAQLPEGTTCHCINTPGESIRL